MTYASKSLNFTEWARQHQPSCRLLNSIYFTRRIDNRECNVCNVRYPLFSPLPRRTRKQGQPSGIQRRLRVHGWHVDTHQLILLQHLFARRTTCRSLARRTYAPLRVRTKLDHRPTRTQTPHNTYPLGYEFILGRAFGLEHVLSTRNSFRSSGCLEGPRAAVSATSLARLRA